MLSLKIKNNGLHYKIFHLNKNYYKLVIKSRYGKLIQYIKKNVRIQNKKDKLIFLPKQQNNFFCNIAKSVRKNIKHLINDAFYGFYIILEIRGVGYYVKEKKKGYLEFNLGTSHKIIYKLKKNVAFKSLNDKGTLFLIVGSNRSNVFLTIFDILNLRKKDYYKGKGIFYYLETIKLKQGKNQRK